MEENIETSEQREGGFTLIELLIVIVILGILAAIVVFSVQGITDRGSRSACQANLEVVNIASEAYRTTQANGQPATSLLVLQTAGFIRTFPVALDSGNNSFTVTPGGGSQYRITYTPGTGVAAATSGAAFGTAGCPTTN